MKINFGKLAREPLLILAALWSLALLAPHLPGLPRPSVSGLPWRQELLLSFLLCLTLGLLLRRSDTQPDSLFNTPRIKLRLLFCGALFAAWMWLSATWAAHPPAAVHLAFQWSAYLIFLALLCGAVSRPRVVRASFKSLGAVIWILGIACAVESWFGAPLTDGNLRNDLKPIFRGSGGFGEIMAVAAPLFAALALQQKRPRRALVCGATAVLAWLGTIQSLERAPFIGASVGLLLFFAVALLKRNCRPRRLSRLGLLAAAFAGVLILQALPLSSPSPLAASRDTSTLTRLQGGFSHDANTHVRLLFWGIGLEMLREHPWQGVGGNNYEVAYTEARAQFSARHPDSPLAGLNDYLLAVYAHNEYVQMLAELGIIGFSLFVFFAGALALTLRRALRHPTQALPALGAGAGMLAFAISSGASASSFRYFGGGLLFFFAAALVARVAMSVHQCEQQAAHGLILLNAGRRLAVVWCAAVLSFAMICSFGTQAAGSMLHGLAQTSVDQTDAENFYKASLRFNQSSAATHYGYGMWLVGAGRMEESLPHLRYAVARGLNSSTCYAYLASAEDEAGDVKASEQTLGEAVRVYPRSVFLRVRHAAELVRAGRDEEAGMEMSAALLIDSRAARGWYQLIVNDIDAAIVAARNNRDIAMPGELQPEAAVFAVLAENEKRFPEAVNTGWRAHMRSTKF
ncbi:MAG: O-antigen ligase family protein [Acidobacteria bacterium]|nr:O-antigen ligase family protein [Acidobacteriota bacterium]